MQATDVDNINNPGEECVDLLAFLMLLHFLFLEGRTIAFITSFVCEERHVMHACSDDVL